ncbi:MAG: ABC transporter ATP-binding protein [Synergistetes bacterium]|nr:ABC transporter ATP-binding protein [Synergistota bacterium]
MEEILRVEGVFAGYAKRIVLKDISFTLRKGEFLALLGPNGAGKSTVLRVLSGVLRPMGGKVSLEGRDLISMAPRERARLVAVVPQRIDFNFPFSVEEAVAMGRYPHGGEDIGEIEWAIKKLGLEELRKRKLLSLSGGEFKRVIIAKALAQKPRLLLLDEPLSHLDLKYQLKLLELLKELLKDGMSIISVFHDINMAFRGPSIVMLLKNGEIKALGPPLEVMTPELVEDIYEVKVKKCNAYGIPHLVY